MRVAVSSAKGHLTELIRRAEAGEEVVLTRHGRAVVRLVPDQARRGCRGGRRKLLQAVRVSGAVKARGRRERREKPGLSLWHRRVCQDDCRRYLRADGDRPWRNSSGCLHTGFWKPKPRVVISAGTVAEALIVAARRNVDEEVSRLIDGLGFEIVSVTPASARRIAAAYARWGRGAHPAGLNFGDCFSYEVAKEHSCPLLYIGDDFSQTDLERAL